uniref:Uncharacterized protein n=1 Tax=Micrurus lemniscatus lemniscatus TaxID=129467 RepID=A0A2D4ISF4_MICLE
MSVYTPIRSHSDAQIVVSVSVTTLILLKTSGLIQEKSHQFSDWKESLMGSKKTLKISQGYILLVFILLDYCQPKSQIYLDMRDSTRRNAQIQEDLLAKINESINENQDFNKSFLKA